MHDSTSVARLALIAGLMLSAPAACLADQETNLLLNGGAEEGKNTEPSIWRAAQVPAEGLRMWQDTNHAHSGRACLAIANEHNYPSLVSNNWAQDVQQVPTGKPVRLTACIRTEDAYGVNVCVQCMSADGKRIISFASTPVLRGTNEWTTLRSKDIVVPPNTAALVVRAALTGTGKAFFDDLTLETVSDSTAPPGDADLKARVNGRIVRTLPVTQDAVIISYLPNNSYGQWDWLAVANNDGGVRTVLSFDRPSVEETGQPEVKFLLALFARETTFKPPAARMQIHEVLNKWDETVSWNDQPSFAPETVASVDMTALANTWWLFDVTKFVRSQVRDGRDNFGVVLKLEKEDRTGAAKDWSGCQFVSREGPATRRPILLVVAPGKSVDSRPASAPASTSQPTTRP